ncbi:MAG: pyrroline-5-carboxylate reductase, partial [Megasphaera sp.]|nr:pyrroline-5-carboxylate reductase [Megasphaera sp.]
TIDRLAAPLPQGTKIIRVMPNTPALVGEGMSALAVNDAVTEDEKAAALAVFESFGKAALVAEQLIDAVCGLSGSGPAYVYMFIEAMADGAVLEGMPRQMAYTFAAQTVLGAAKMVLETGEHPGKLKDDVCSPGGTTIEAVRVLEEKGFRAAAAAAVVASTEKNKAL